MSTLRELFDAGKAKPGWVYWPPDEIPANWGEVASPTDGMLAITPAGGLYIYASATWVWVGGEPPPTPLLISNCVCWLRADGIVGLADTDPVSTWSDESVEGRDATAAGTLRPLYRTGIQNGLPVVRFDGSNDVMDILGLGSEFGGSAGTFFVVYGINNGDTAYSVVELSSAASGDAIGWWRYTDTNRYANFFRSNRLGALAGQATTGFHYVTIRSGATNGYDWRLDGVLDIDTTTSWGVGTDARIGYDDDISYLNGDVCEIIFYDRELTDAEVTTIEGYLTAKWAV